MEVILTFYYRATCLLGRGAAYMVSLRGSAVGQVLLLCPRWESTATETLRFTE